MDKKEMHVKQLELLQSAGIKFPLYFTMYLVQADGEPDMQCKIMSNIPTRHLHDSLESVVNSLSKRLEMEATEKD